jgi:lipoprotein-anchoring transpeptidase ErfK/SrfK
MITSLLSRIATAAACLTLMACGPVNVITKGTGGAPFTQKAEHVLYQWYDDGGPGELKVRIDLSEQQAYYTRGGRDVGWSFVATGKEGHGTPPGTYRISEKIVDKYSNRYGWIEDEWGNVTNGDATPGTRVPPGERYVPAPMPFWMRITSNGIGMHAGVIPKPGETASHGCIRLPRDFAPTLFDNVRVGTPVTIVY